MDETFTANVSLLKQVGFSLVLLTVAACAPFHPGGELVEKGVLRAETSGTDDLQVKQVWVHADAEGTHIHGNLQRKIFASNAAGHVEVTLIDRTGAIVYQGTMEPMRWNANPRYKNSFLQEETFHIVTPVSVPEQGVVRVVYHSGPKHENKKP